MRIEERGYPPAHCVGGTASAAAGAAARSAPSSPRRLLCPAGFASPSRGDGPFVHGEGRAADRSGENGGASPLAEARRHPALLFPLILALTAVGVSAEQPEVPPQAYGFYGQALHDLMTGAIDAAIRNLTECVKIDPYSAEPRYHLGRLHMMRGNLNEAVEHLRKAAEARPEDIRIKQLLVQAYMGLGKSGEGLKTYQSLAAAMLSNNDASAPQVILRFVKVLADAGERGPALEWLRKARSLRNDDPTYHLSLGLLARAAGFWPDAAEEFELYLSSVPLEPTIKAEMLDDYYADAAMKAGLKDKAMAARAAALKEISQLCDRLGKDGNKGSELRRAKRRMAVILEHARQYDEAVLLLRTCLDGADNEEKAELFGMIGSILDRADHFEDAEKAYLEGLKVTPDSHLLKNNLSYLYATRGKNLDSALKLIKEALDSYRKEVAAAKTEKDPEDMENGAYVDTLGWVLFKLGKKEEALEEVRRAAKMEPSAEVYDHLGDIYKSLGRDKEAAEAWERSLQLDPLVESVRAKLRSTSQ